MTSEVKKSRLKPLMGIGTIIALSTLAFLFRPPTPITTPPELLNVLWPEPRQLTAFALNAQDQEPFDLDRLAGKWTLLFFGYTHCPDICPTTLTTMKAVYNGLAQNPEIQNNTQFVFISVDPARDSPEVIGNYVAYFDKSFIGATGSVEDIDNLTHQLNARYVLEKPDESGAYLVEHTGSIYLIGPKQQAHGTFSPPHTPSTIVTQYLDVLKHRGET